MIGPVYYYTPGGGSEIAYEIPSRGGGMKYMGGGGLPGMGQEVGGPYNEHTQNGEPIRGDALGRRRG